MQSNAGNKNSEKFQPSFCFSLQKCDKDAGINYGLSQLTINCLETVMLCPYCSQFLTKIDISQKGHGSVNLVPAVTFFRVKNFRS